MENIRQAVDKARIAQPLGTNVSQISASGTRLIEPTRPAARSSLAEAPEIALNEEHLRRERVVSHDPANQHSRAYDMLRIQTLQAMKVKGWRVLGITSPTPECGKTLTAVNLAFSVARQPGHGVVMIDADLQRPNLAGCVGVVPPGRGLLDVLDNSVPLQRAFISVHINDERLLILPTATTRRSSETLGSDGMQKLLADVKKLCPADLVIVDLPPVLTGSDVMTILPHIDCWLLVVAVGQSKASEIEDCNKHLSSANLLRVVVNKSTDASALPYYY